MRRILSLVVLTVLGLGLQAQLAPGRWESLISLNATKKVVVADSRTYYLSQSGIFYLNHSDNELVSLTKSDGLSELEFSTMAYNSATKKLVVAYANSNIDIISADNKIVQLSDIKRKSINGDKTIYSISCYEQFCYLSCGFGIVVVDLQRMEVSNTYIIGDGGNYLPVYDIGFSDDGKIYAATKQGVRYAPLSGVNLLDYSNWITVDVDGLHSYNFNFVSFGAGRIWVAHQSDKWMSDRTFSRHAESVWYQEIASIQKIYDFDVHGNLLYYCTDKGIEVVDRNGIRQVFIDKYPFATADVSISPVSVMPDSNGALWIADLKYGAIRYFNGNFERYLLPGPSDNSIFSLTFADNKLWVANGGRSQTWYNSFQRPIVQGFSGETWEVFNRLNVPEFNEFDMYDAVCVLPFPGKPDHFYVSIWGQGIVEIKAGKVLNHYDQNNSSFDSYELPKTIVRVGGMAFDKDGNLWANNSLVENKINRMTPAGEWKSFYIPQFSGTYHMGKILVTKNNVLWMQVGFPEKGLLIMSTDAQSVRKLDVTAYFRNDKVELLTPMKDVYSLVEDHNGQIWVGTSTGVAVYSNPKNVFENTAFYANRPSVDNSDGLFKPLLENKVITAIAVDGGNQKWIGTRGEGLFLVSDDGTQQLEEFNTNNSPLISNDITSLAYDDKTGMLYIGTSLGLVRYKTKTIGSAAAFNKVYAYPNPVRETYKGEIYVTGLMENTNVKITDIAGRLVFETTSEGGQATWNGNDLTGRRVHTGVYLVFCASEDGQESAVTKILFIR
jgi:hypothetical protein